MEHKIPECFSIIHGFINMEIHFSVPREECCTKSPGVSRCGSDILGLRHKVGRHGRFPSMCLPGGFGAGSCCNLARPGEIMDQKLHGSPTRRWLRSIQLRCWWLWPLSRPSYKDQWVQGLPDFPIKGISLETSDATPSTNPRATEQPLLDLLLAVWPLARILHFRVLVFVYKISILISAFREVVREYIPQRLVRNLHITCTEERFLFLWLSSSALWRHPLPGAVQKSSDQRDWAPACSDHSERRWASLYLFCSVN